MTDQVTLTSKVLVLDDNADCHAQIKTFCDSNHLMGLKVQDEGVLSVLKSNVDLGAIMLSEKFGGSISAAIALARQIHSVRPELPIFLRRDSVASLEGLDNADKKLFSVAYTIEGIEVLRQTVDEFIFSLTYPNALVSGITEITISALKNQFRQIDVQVDAPYIVRDRIIFGEIFTLIPIESSWCRGYMMFQVEEESLLKLVRANKTYIDPQDSDDFRNLNGLLGEITNLVWGAFKNRYMMASNSGVAAHLTQVPLIINHQHKYISFGSTDPQLCFKYTLSDTSLGQDSSLVIYQRFVFNLSWSPEDFEENQTSADNLVEAGDLELF